MDLTVQKGQKIKKHLLQYDSNFEMLDWNGWDSLMRQFLFSNRLTFFVVFWLLE